MIALEYYMMIETALSCFCVRAVFRGGKNNICLLIIFCLCVIIMKAKSLFLKDEVNLMGITEFFSYGFVMKYLTDNASTLDDAVIFAIYTAGIIFAAIVAYLLGSLNFAIIISKKQYSQDIRAYGSNNAGMTNMMRTYGTRAAGLTLLGDALKAVVATLIGYAVIGQLGAYVAGCACILGHIFPVFYKFKGGKGVVTTAVTILMCNPYVFLILIVLYVGIVALSKYISLASVMCMLVYPAILYKIDVWLNGVCPYIIFALFMSVLVIFKHMGNIKRLLSGTENKFSFKKSVKKTNTDKKDN